MTVKKCFYPVLFLLLFLYLPLKSQDIFLPVSSPSKQAIRYYEQALGALFEAEFEDMKDFMDLALTHDPQFFMAYFQLAMLDWRFKAKTKFDRNYIKALSCRVELSETEQVCRQILMGLQEDLYTDVSSLGEKLVGIQPDILEAHLWHGRLSRWSGDPQQAINAYQRIVELNPDFAPVYNLLAYAYMATGNMEKAAISFDRYIEVQPDHPNPYDSKGDYFLTTGHYKKAEAHFSKALDLDDTFSDSGAKLEVSRAMQIVEKETTSFFKKDYAGWLSCYQQSPSAFHSYTDKNVVRQFEGWQNIARAAKQIMEDMPNTPLQEVERKNLNWRIMGENIWLTFDQYMGDSVSKEMRLLEKVDGDWKMVLMSAVGVSTYEEEPVSSND